MTLTCKKNIARAINKTNKLLDDFENDSKKTTDILDESTVKPIYMVTMKLNKNYKLEINMTPIGTATCELVYYIVDYKDIAIDQITYGNNIDYYHDHTDMIRKDLEYLLNMYC